MNFYSIGYSNYEGSPEIILTHEKLFTQQEFEEMVAECAAEYIKEEWDNYQKAIQEEYKDSPDDDTLELELKKDDIKRAYRNFYTFSHLKNPVIDKLISKHGFTKLQLSAKINPYGDGCILADDSYLEENLSEEDYRLFSLIKSKLSTQQQ